jgi:hypothetical protein
MRTGWIFSAGSQERQFDPPGASAVIAGDDGMMGRSRTWAMQQDAIGGTFGRHPRHPPQLPPERIW